MPKIIKTHAINRTKKRKGDHGKSCFPQGQNTLKYSKGHQKRRCPTMSARRTHVTSKNVMLQKKKAKHVPVRYPTNVRPGNLMKMFLLAMAIRHATVVNANRTGQQPNRGNPNPKDPTKRHVKPTTSVSLTHALELLARTEPPQMLNVAKRQYKPTTATVTMSTTE